MQFELDTFVQTIWTNIANHLRDAGNIEPHALLGDTEAVDEKGIAMLRLGSVPKEAYHQMLQMGVKEVGADFAVLIHEAWVRVAKGVTREEDLPHKYVGAWPHIKRVIDTDAMETSESVVVAYTTKGGVVTLETMDVKRLETGNAELVAGSLKKTTASENRFLDGLFPPDPAKVH